MDEKDENKIIISLKITSEEIKTLREAYDNCDDSDILLFLDRVFKCTQNKMKQLTVLIKEFENANKENTQLSLTKEGF